MELAEKRSIFDLSIVEIIKPTWEKAIYAAIGIVAVISRFWNLGLRAMSHDESLHAIYSYYLYNGTGYQVNPMMHGPFKFHATALIYFLFGDTDFTARILAAVFGVILVLSPLLLRRWLGKVGAVVVSLLLLISPTILYYSRYIRDDILICVWSVLLVAAFFQFLHTRKVGWFYFGAAVLSLSITTMESAYIFAFMGAVFIVEVVLWERARSRQRPLLYLVGAALSIGLLIAGFFLARAAASAAASAQAAAAASGATASDGLSKVLKLVGALSVVIGGTIPAALISSTLISIRSPRPNRVLEAFRTLPLRAWLIAVAIMAVIYVLLFTTFFTYPPGLLGFFNSISYWLAQQDVHRGGQPWYYYFLVLAMYEFVPFLFSLVGTLYYLLRGRPKGDELPLPSALLSTPVPGGGGVGELPDEQTRSAPAPETGQGSSGQDLLSAAGPGGGELNAPMSEAGFRPLPTPSLPFANGSEESTFISFLIFWSVSALFIYSWAGEKMPWLVVHIVLPMILLAGKFAGDLLSKVNWQAAWRRGAALLIVLLPVSMFGLYTLINKRPFQGMSIFKLQQTGTWLLALLVTLFLLVLVGLVARRLGGRHSVLVGFGASLAFLSFFTARFAWMASYINYDYATEFLVYAHGGADVVPMMNEIANISARTVGDHQIEVAYDNDVTWPLEWYLRLYPNRKYYGENPTRDLLNVPIILSGDANDAKVQPLVGDRYYRFKERLVWWPDQEYFGLTWQRVVDILGNPDKRHILWDILYWRKYPKSPDDWYHVHNMYLYIRKDVAQQLWDFGATPPSTTELLPDPYVEAHVDLQTAGIWGGTVGTTPGTFNHPRGIAVGPDGNVYVVDSDNARVEVFSPDGTFLREWGSYCDVASSSQGCVDPDGDGPLVLGDGQFREPWGIAVGKDGRVYVADTWNHRIQVFDSNGNFLTKWGVEGLTTSLGSVFYGPRDVAIDKSGNVLVADTGNKRIVVFDAEGNALSQFGTDGAGPGQFKEPVGIDVDSRGMIYVADTWNGRVQVFDASFAYLEQWPVDGWYGTSVVNKPYLAVDGRGRVYVTDPEGCRVAVFSGDGQLLSTFGACGTESDAFSLPTGIAVDHDGYIYITDTDGQRVMKFEPLP